MQALQSTSVGADSADQSGKILLTVDLPAGISGRCFAGGGVLFPRGSLFNGDRVRLCRADGRLAQVQSQVLARYAMDGSIRSLYTIFQVNAGTGDTPRFTLKYGVSSALDPAAARITVKERGDEVSVSTGKLAFRMNRNGFRLFDRVWFDANGDGAFSDNECVLDATTTGGLSVIDDGGLCWESRLDKPTLVVERAGPLTAVIRAQGWHRAADGRALVGYIVRVHAYAGSADLKIEHTFENLRRSGTPPLGLRSIALTLPLQRIAAVSVGATRKLLPVGSEVYALQSAFDNDLRGTVVTRHDLHAEVMCDGTVVDEVAELDGYFRFSTNRTTLALRIEDFGENYPLAVRADRSGVTVELWPSRGVKMLALTHGMAKTHRFWLGFSAETGARAFPPGTARVCADPAYMIGTEAMTWGITPEQSTFHDLEKLLKRSFGLAAATREVVKPIGKFNVGDQPQGHSGQGWNNSETALSRNWLVHYIRTGDEQSYRIAECMVRHTMDVDVDHVHGNQYTHNMHHALGGIGHTSHNYPEILSLYYLLSGDALALDIARRNAASCRTWVGAKWRTWMKGRGHGWPAWHVAEMCDVTCEKINLEVAEMIAKRFRESIKIVDGKHVSLSGKGGLLYGGTNLNALLRIHRSLGSANARSSFLEELDWTIKQVRSIGTWTFSSRFSIMADPMVYAWRLTGDRKYIDLGLEALANAALCDDPYLTNCIPLVAAALELGIEPSPQPPYVSWGFKRQHSMYIQEAQDGPFQMEYRRYATGKESEWWLKLHAPDWQLVLDRTFEPMKEAQGNFELPADGLTGTWRLEVHQGYPAMVDFAFSAAPKVVLAIEPNLARFSNDSARYWFLVPKDTEQFSLAIRQYYGGASGGLAVYDPTGQRVRSCHWTPAVIHKERQWHELKIDVSPEMRGRLWSMVAAMYGGQYQLRMDGVPAFVATSPETFFLPDE